MLPKIVIIDKLYLYDKSKIIDQGTEINWNKSSHFIN